MESARNMWVKPVVKSSTTKLVRKSKPIAVEVALANNTKGPNMSRKNQGTKIYSFPSFDKCDSLSFFPSTFTSFINSGDINSLRRLMKTRIDKDCKFDLSGHILSIPSLLAVFECMNELRPDCVLCVHTTKVVGNQIQALIYSKYTESKALRETLNLTYPDRDAFNICTSNNSSLGRLHDFITNRPYEERIALTAIATQSSEIMVYGRAYLTLTFDESTKNVTNLSMDCEFTSVVAV